MGWILLSKKDVEALIPAPPSTYEYDLIKKWIFAEMIK